MQSPAYQKIDTLYRKFGGCVLARAKRVLRDEEEAHEVLQTVFTNLLSVAGQLEDSPRTYHYIYKCASNESYKRLKARQRIEVLVEKLQVLPEVSHPQQKEGSVPLRLDLNKIEGALSSEELLLIYHRFFEELSFEEIGLIHEISDRAISKRWTKLKTKLQRLLKKHGYSSA